MQAIDQLTLTQQKVSFAVNNNRDQHLALLGIASETGQLLKSWFDPKFPYQSFIGASVHDFITRSGWMESIKQRLLQGVLPVDHMNDHRDEIVDHLSNILYFLNAAAITYGVTIEELAERATQNTFPFKRDSAIV